MKKGFKDIAGGKTQAEIRLELKNNGIYISSSALSCLIRNKLYIGQIYVKTNKDDKGFYVKGLHKPLIEQALFDKVQQLFAYNHSNKKFSKAKSFKPELFLRGLITCGSCGNNLTGSASRSRNG